MLHGVLTVDKPAGMTSHDVVDRIRRAARMRRVGHTGTLDPMATGVLPLCLGRATKIAQFLLAEDKEYEVEMLLGRVTDSQDITGRVVETREVEAIDQARVEAVFSRFVGPLMQVPPMVSAKHHQGRRLYELARQGVVVERPPRPVTIWQLELSSLRLPYVAFRVHCSKGTYIRTLCHDLGQVLGSGGAMSALVRTRCGSFTLEDAAPLSELAGREAIQRRLRSMDEALSRYPAVVLQPGAARRVIQGQAIAREQLHSWDRPFKAGQLVRLHAPGGRLFALAEAGLDTEALARPAGGRPVLQPVKVLAESSEIPMA